MCKANLTHFPSTLFVLFTQMVLTQNQTTAFFTNAAQMNILDATIPGLVAEGIVTVDDLSDFKTDEFVTLAANLRRAVPDPFALGAKSLKRLKVAANAVRYYDTIGRPLTALNMHYGNCLVTFEAHWDSLITKKKDGDAPEVPKITKTLTITKWIETFEDFLFQTVGIRMIPLAYVIRANDIVPVAAPPLLTGMPYSAQHESVVGELIARASHAHANFADDNAKLYQYVEEATRSTEYAPSIRPFSRRKNGRGAWLALLGQYAGKDIWLAEIKRCEQIIHGRIWKGNSNYTLETFVGHHRASYIQLERCANYVDYQLPNERTRVTHLLDSIECSDATLQASMANVRADDQGKMVDFEAMAAYLIPSCPVAKKRSTSSGRRDNHQISAIEMIPHKGETGVELCYHTPEMYRTLNEDQKEELFSWREKKRQGKSDGNGDSKRQRTSGATKRNEKAMKQVISSLTSDKEWMVALVKTAIQESAAIPAAAAAVTIGAATTVPMPAHLPPAPLPPPTGRVPPQRPQGILRR